MARPASRGLTYMSLDVNFFKDRMIRRLRRRAGKEAPSIFIAILCSVFAEGYYLIWDDDVAFDLADMTGYDEESIIAVVEACLELGLLSKEMKEKHCVLTSHGIQKQYQQVCKQTKRADHVDEYSLLISSEETPIPSEETPVSSEEISKNSEEMQQRKEKKNKVNTSSLPSSPYGEEVSAENEEKEKIVYLFTFQKNWAAPNAEYEKMVRYNSGAKVKHKWSELSEGERKDIAGQWRQVPETQRFGASFLRVWQQTYDSLMTVAPWHIRMALLDDGVTFRVEKQTFFLCIPRSAKDFLEEHMDLYKRHLWPFVQKCSCTKLMYSLYDPDG